MKNYILAIPVGGQRKNLREGNEIFGHSLLSQETFSVCASVRKEASVRVIETSTKESEGKPAVALKSSENVCVRRAQKLKFLTNQKI